MRLFERVRTFSGFSATELMVTLSIISVLTATGVGSYVESVSTYDRDRSVSLLESDLRRARSEAILKGARVIVYAHTAGDGYSIGIDRPPYASSGVDETFADRTLPNKVTVSFSDRAIFSSRGFLVGSSPTLGVRYDGTSFCSITPSQFGFSSDSCS